MGVVVRLAASSDAVAWLELLKVVFGKDYPDRQVYDPAWVAQQLDPASGDETWVTEMGGQLQAAVALLGPSLPNRNPVMNLGRQLARPESYSNGTMAELLRKVVGLADERRAAVIARVLSSDNPCQVVFEQEGFVCVGFQPFKHWVRAREGALFYLRPGLNELGARLPLSESLSQVHELATAVLGALKLSEPVSVRDGVTGYPLQSELQLEDVSFEDYQRGRTQSQSLNPPVEISGGYHLGWGLLRVAAAAPLRAMCAVRGSEMAAALAYTVDERDRCVRLADGFTNDDLSSGVLFQRLVKMAQEKFNATYVEADVLMTAPRLLKSMEQLGFVPVAYLPGFCQKGAQAIDVVKLVKLNLAYSLEGAQFTAHAKQLASIVDRNFQDQKMGVAIINLLRGLSIFAGLGDGELRKMARLFTQKLFRPQERIFSRGDQGAEAYIVMRGQVDIRREATDPPLATFGNGQIFGELAFLDGAPRTALAVAGQPSILLVVQRDAFNDLVQREPHLGMVVMRNIALELSNRLRRAAPPPAEPKK